MEEEMTGKEIANFIKLQADEGNRSGDAGVRGRGRGLNELGPGDKPPAPGKIE